jgi:hypothetical protein
MQRMNFQTIGLSSVLLIGLVMVTPASAQEPAIKTTVANGTSTVRMTALKIGGEKDHYYSLHLAPSYTYKGAEPTMPESIDFEIHTVVKKRRLNPDLYVVFVIDGERIFLSSNRSAVKNPVPRKRWIGERITMRMPLETYLKLARAGSSVIQMGRTSFVIGSEQKAAMLKLLRLPAA